MRIGILKEKMTKNVDEIKILAKLFRSNLMRQRKPKYFQILKNKKIREESSITNEKFTQNKKVLNKQNFLESVNQNENIYNFNYSSESEKHSLNEELTSSIKNEYQIFKRVFDPDFVSINHFKEEDDEFLDLTNKLAYHTVESNSKINLTNLSNNFCSSNQVNFPTNEPKNSIFTEDEIKDFSNIFEDLKNMNISYKDVEKNCLLDDFSELLFKKKKYKIRTTEEKKKLVEMTKQSNVKLISRKYGVPFKSLKRWVLYGCDRKKGGGRKEKDPKMEAQLYKWYKEFHLKNNNYVTSKILKKKALELSKYPEFLASKDWLNKFKRKYNVETIRESDLITLLKNEENIIF